PKAEGRLMLYSGWQLMVHDPGTGTTVRIPPFVSTLNYTSERYTSEPSFVEAPANMRWSNGGDRLWLDDEQDGSTRSFRDPALPVLFPLHTDGDSLIIFGSEAALGFFHIRSEIFSSVPYPIPAEG